MTTQDLQPRTPILLESSNGLKIDTVVCVSDEYIGTAHGMFHRDTGSHVRGWWRIVGTIEYVGEPIKINSIPA